MQTFQQYFEATFPPGVEPFVAPTQQHVASYKLYVTQSLPVEVQQWTAQNQPVPEEWLQFVADVQAIDDTQAIESIAWPVIPTVTLATEVPNIAERLEAAELVIGLLLEG